MKEKNVISFDGKSMYGNGSCFFSGNRPFAEINGKNVFAQFSESSSEGTYTLSFPGTALEWHWNFKHTSGRVIVESHLINKSDVPLKLGILAWIHTDDLSIFSGDEENFSVLETPYANRGYYRQIKQLNDPLSWGTSANFAQFFNAQNSLAIQLGFLTFRKTLNFVSYGDSLQAACDFAGWELEGNSEFTCDVFTAAAGTDPMKQLEEWAALAAHIIKPVFRHRPALGLGGGWPDPREIPEAGKAANARALCEKLKDFGFEFVWVSIANIPGGDPGAYKGWNSKNFPGGLKNLVDTFAEMGLKLGFWMGPYLLSSHLTEMVEEFDDALLRDKEGERLIYYKIWSHGDARHLPKDKRPKIYALDPSHPKVIKFLKEVFTQYREAGVRYYMLDFLEAGSGDILRKPYLSHHDKKQIAGPEVLVNSMKAMREAIGEDTFILTSTGPLLQMAGYADAVRTGNDFGESRAIAPDSNFYPASFVINGSFTSAEAALNAGALVYYMHNKLFLNDSGNVLTVDQPIPLESARIHAAIHALSGASSMLGDDLRNIAPERLSLIKKTLPRAVDIARPLDLFNAQNRPPCKFHRSIVKNGGSWEVIAVYNLTGSERSESIDLTSLGIAPERKCQVWEFWTESYCGSCRNTLDVTIPPESVRVFRVTAEEERPVIIGTDMHVLMGEMELSQVKYDEEKRLLTFTAERPVGESGSVFLHMPQDLCLDKNKSDICYTARNRDGINGELILRVPLYFSEKHISKELYFVPIKGIGDDRFM